MNTKFIDLGLPSGTLWGDRNLGADRPEDFGDYFRFGELNPLTEKCNEYKQTPTSKEYDFYGKDNTNIACTIYDVAQMKFNINSCIPNITQINELKEYCKKEYIKVSGIEGMKFTGPNGLSIFFPAGGKMENWIPLGENRLEISNEYGPEDKKNHGVEIWGFYWSSNRISYFPDNLPYRRGGGAAVELEFSKNHIYTDVMSCREGLLIRPTKYVNQSNIKWMEKFYLSNRVKGDKYFLIK